MRQTHTHIASSISHSIHSFVFVLNPISLNCPMLSYHSQVNQVIYMYGKWRHETLSGRYEKNWERNTLTSCCSWGPTIKETNHQQQIITRHFFFFFPNKTQTYSDGVGGNCSLNLVVGCVVIIIIIENEKGNNNKNTIFESFSSQMWIGFKKKLIKGIVSSIVTQLLWGGCGV